VQEAEETFPLNFLPELIEKRSQSEKIGEQHLETDYDFKSMSDDQIHKQTSVKNSKSGAFRGFETPKIDISETDAKKYGIAKSFECLCTIGDRFNDQTINYEPTGTRSPVKPEYYKPYGTLNLIEPESSEPFRTRSPFGTPNPLEPESFEPFLTRSPFGTPNPMEPESSDPLSTPSPLKPVIAYTPRCKFHQHFTSTFFVRKCFAKVFSSYGLGL